jgi:hypothetical protein
MSVFHQLKNLFQNNSKYSPSLSSEQRKAKKYETVADIVRKDSIKKSQLPSYAGLEKYELISKLGE